MRIGLGIGLGILHNGGGIDFSGTVPECSPDVPAAEWGLSFTGTVPECSPDVPAATWHLWVLTDEGDMVLALDPTVGVTKDGSDRVSSWADQSPSGLTYDAFGTYRPTYLATGINGKPSISGDGSLNWLEGSAAVDLSAATGITLIFVGQSNETALGVMFESTSLAPVTLGVYANGVSAGDLGFTFNGGGVQRGFAANETGTDLATPGVVCVMCDSTLTGTAQVKGWLNGTLLTHSSDSGADVGTGFGNQKLNLFARTTSALHWQGEYGHVILLDVAASQATRERITRNLGAIYGITIA